MSETTNNKYKATFILDLRQSEDDAQKVLSDITAVIGTINGSVTGSEDLGVREFSRAADRHFSQGHYLQVDFSGAGNAPANLKEKLRLDKRVNRVFIEAL